MPYRHAHYWLLLLYPITFLAFWRDYFSKLAEVPYAFHFHGFTASLWIALLTVQSWTIHHRQNKAHRSIGYASFLLFPLFMAGGMMVIQTMALTTAAGVSPFYNLYGAQLAMFDLIATVGIGAFFFMALKYRRKVHVHSRYMLATIFFLFGPIFARLLPGLLPPIAITGPDTFYRFVYAYHLANLIALAITLALYFRSGRFGRPFLVASGLILLQSLTFETVARTAAWRGIVYAIGATPTSALVSLAIAASAAIIWLGWTAGHGPRQAVPAAGGA